MLFRYTACDSQLRRHCGKLDAPDARSARNQLREQGLQVESLKPARIWLQNGLRPDGLRKKELAFFTRQLATLCGAALPLGECLQILENQSEKSAQRHMVRSLLDKIREGETLASAMNQWPRFFSPVYRATVSAGETSGQLSHILTQLAEYTENTQAMKSRLKQAMIYPVMLTLVAGLVVTVLLTAVVPQVTEQFVHMHQTLPASTRLLLAISELFSVAGPWIISTLAFIAIALRVALRKSHYRLTWHRLLIQLPLLGRTLRELEMTRYARTLSVLNQSAVPLTQAMLISADVLTNSWIRAAMISTAERVHEGMSFSHSLKTSGLASPVMLHLITSGERSGELSSMLTHTADIQEKQFNTRLSVTMSLFEPVLVVSMSGVVLFIIMAILQPILQLNSLIG